MLVKRLIKDKTGQLVWISDEVSFGKKENKRNLPKRDLTIDQYIAQNGGIFSHADCKIYYSKRTYLDSLKAQNMVIKDW